MKRTLFAWALLLLGTANLSAGYVLTYHLDRFSNEGVKTSCMETDYIDGSKMRVETQCQDPASHATVSIYRGDKKLIWQIDPESKRYTEMTRSQVEKSRKVFEDEMRSTGKHSYQPTGKTDKINNWTCTVYQHIFHGTLADEFCITDTGQVFKGADEAETTKRHLLEILDPMAIDPEEQNQLADLAMGVARFTLKQVNILLDQPAYILIFKEGRSDPLPASVFELPRGAVLQPVSP